MSEIEVGNLVAKISLDDTGLDKSMAQIQREMKLVQSEFQKASAGMKEFGGSSDQLRTKADALTKQIGLQQQKVNLLNEEFQKAAKEKGEDAVATQKLATQLNKAQADLSSLQNELKATNAEITKQSSTFTKLADTFSAAGQQMRSFGQGMADVGRSLSLTLTAPIVALGGLATKASIDFESAFAGVRKTIDATETEFATFKQEILDMSKTIPASAIEIAKVAEAAGQLGIKKEAIMGFTRTMVDLGVATNMTSDEAATALARLANITQMPQENFDRLGATIVELGNNLATTESEIVAMGLRIAGAGNQIGLTEAQILAFAGALSSVGIEAEAGGSAISRVMIDIAQSVQMGGDDLKLFAQVAGMSASEFQAAFKQDAADAILSFIEGLGRMSASGQNTFGVLDKLSLSEIRVRDALLRASGAGDLFRNSIDLASQAWVENTALTKEAEERYGTTASQLAILQNNVTAIGITLGDALRPALMSVVSAMKPLLEKFADAAKWFTGLDESMQRVVIAIGTAAAAIGPSLVVFGTLIQSAGTIASAFGSVSLAIAEAGGLMAVLTGPVGIAVAAIGGLVAAGVLLYQNWETIKAYAIQVWGQIQNFIQPVVEEVAGFITDKFGELRDWWIQIWPDLQRAFENVWNGIFTFIIPTLETIKAVWVATWPYVQNVFAAVWDAIKGVISGSISIIKGVIDTFIGVFTGDWSRAWEGVKSILSGVWDSMASILGSAINIILNLLGGLVAGIAGYFTGIGQQMTKYGGDIVRGLGEGITSMATWVKEKALSIATSITGAIKEFFGIASPSKLMMEYGRYIVEGLWQGIKDMAGWLKGKVTEFASEIANSIKSFFGIASPSKLMAEYGGYIAEGLAVGMRQNEKLVADAAKAQAEIVKKKTQEAKDAAVANWKEMNAKVKTEVDLMAQAITGALEKVRSTTQIELAISKQEFELFASTLGTTTADEAKKLEAQMELLRIELATSNETVDLLKQAYDDMAAAKGENSEEAKKLYLELLKEQTAYQGIKKELSELEKQYEKTTKAASNLLVQQGKIFEKINGNWVESGWVGGRIDPNDPFYDGDWGENGESNWLKPKRPSGNSGEEEDSGRRRPKDTDKEGAYQKDVDKDNFGGSVNTNVRKAAKEVGDSIRDAFDKVKESFRLPGLATGGTVTRSGWTWVGEKGPELLNLPRGSQVIPNYDLPNARSSNGVQNFNFDVRIEGPVNGISDLREQMRDVIKNDALPILSRQLRQPARARG